MKKYKIILAVIGLGILMYSCKSKREIAGHNMSKSEKREIARAKKDSIEAIPPAAVPKPVNNNENRAKSAPKPLETR